MWTPEVGTFEDAGFTITKGSGSATYVTGSHVTIEGVSGAGSTYQLSPPSELRHGAIRFEVDADTTSSYSYKDPSGIGFLFGEEESMYRQVRTLASLSNIATTKLFSTRYTDGTWHNVTSPGFDRLVRYALVCENYPGGNCVLTADGINVLSFASYNASAGSSNCIQIMRGTYRIYRIAVKKI